MEGSVKAPSSRSVSVGFEYLTLFGFFENPSLKVTLVTFQQAKKFVSDMFCKLIASL